MRRVELSSTHFEKFTCSVKVGNDYRQVDPTSFYAVLETYTDTPETIEDLSCTKLVLGEYVVKFYADKDKYATKDTYYINFYWEYNSTKMCQRVPITIEVDV